MKRTGRGRTLGIVAAFLATCLAAASPAPAQDAPADADDGIGLVGGGLLGAGLGFAAGALAGVKIGGDTCEDVGNPDSCLGIEGLYIGANLGAALGTSLGVHLANGRRGSLGWSTLFTTGLAAGGILAVRALERRDVAVGVVFVLPVANLLGSVAIERRTSSAPRTR